MSCYIIRPKNHDEWLQCRGLGIGSSEVGTLLGLNPWETPYQLWRRKKGLDAPKQENFAMKAGHYLEDAVSRFYEDESGREIIKSSAGDWLMVDRKRDYLRVSPDRLFWVSPTGRRNNANKGICECKTSQMRVDAENPPLHWFCQLQYQLYVAGYELGSLAWLTQGRDFGYIDVARDDDFCCWMVERIDEYWQRYVVGNEIPGATTAQDVLLKSPVHQEGKTIEATEEIMAALTELRQCKSEAKEIETHAEQLENDIKVFFGDAESIVDGQGRVLASWKAPKESRRFDAKKAEEYLTPEQLEECYTPHQGARRLTIKAYD